MADTKPLPRGFTSREASERPRSWQPPRHLPDPTPEAGYVFRWVRISALGEDDPRNISLKLREGWEPVKASEHPEVFSQPTEKSRFPDSIQIGGLMLCKMPEEFVAQRSEYYRTQSSKQTESVDNSFMRENDSRMPLFNERKTSVTFGRGNS